jgi:GTP-binding protein
MDEFQDKFWFFNHAPVLTVSGLERRRVTKVFPLIEAVIGERKKRIGTAELNTVMRRAMPQASLPLYRGRAVKLFYMTQVKTDPPEFVVFANHPEGLKDSHLRFLERSLREQFSFSGTPIRIFVRPRSGERK